MTRRTMVLDLHPDDQDPPMAGDVLATARKVYRVVASREVDSRVWCNRWSVTLEYLGERDTVDVEATAGGARAHYSGRYRPGETPAQFFGRAA